MTLVEHLDELRTRLLRSIIVAASAIIVAMFFYRRLVDLAVIPHFRAMSWLTPPPPTARFIAGGYVGAVGSVMKLASIVGVFFSSPVIARELWAFISAGLYPEERRYVRAFAPASFLLFLLGCAFGYFILIPYSLFAMATALPLDKVDPVFNFGEYLQLFLTLTLILGGLFQLPLVMVFLAKLGVVGPDQYRSWRKHALVGNVVGAAVIAPPDLLSMGVFVVPLAVLYELGILGSALALRIR
jgi:sec-independent protein translocase protein TatC